MWLTNNLQKKSPIYLVDNSDERIRIAREFHDGIAQDLAAIGYAIDSEIGRSDTTAHSRKSLRGIREQITLLNTKVRNEIFELRSLRDPEPHHQLEVTLESLQLNFTIHGHLVVSNVGLELSKVIQELARNAKVHGGATRITILCESSRIIVEHNGENDEAKGERGLGLAGLAERLANINWGFNFSNGYTHVEIFELP